MFPDDQIEMVPPEVPSPLVVRLGAKLCRINRLNTTYYCVPDRYILKIFITNLIITRGSRYYYSHSQKWRS